MSDGKVHVIYHGGCPDGFTSLWVATKRYGRDNVVAWYGRYGEPPPADIPDGAEVVIADFSYPRDQLVEFCKRMGTVWVFDHHQTAEADLAGLDDEVENLTVVFDMDRSGAGITWDECFGQANPDHVYAIAGGADYLSNRPGGAAGTIEIDSSVMIEGETLWSPQSGRPVLLNFVEARDLWRMELADVAEIGAFIMTLEHDLDVWDEAMKIPRSDLVDRGAGALAQRQQFTRAVMPFSYLGLFQPPGMYPTTMPVVNVSYPIGSETAQALMEHYGHDMAAYYFQRADGTWQYGFRARNGSDCSVLAKAFGGGGHREASGCQGFPEQIHLRM